MLGNGSADISISLEVVQVNGQEKHRSGWLDEIVKKVCKNE